MNEQELGRRIVALTATLYRVSCGLLRSEADREDAVPGRPSRKHG